jgi:putative glutamine amidotransferase
VSRAQRRAAGEKSSGRPRIAITSERHPGEESAGGSYDRVRGAYARCVAEAGGTPVIIPTVGYDPGLIATYLDAADGLVLSGGEDVHPSFYGEIVLEKCGPIDEKRDLFEFALFHGAVARAMPILGICRGMQVMAVASGGSLYQDVAYCPGAETIHIGTWQACGEMPSVRLAPGSLLRRIIGKASLPINCHHHQLIKALSRDCRVGAVAADGMIEGIEMARAPFVVGVHWHPERLAEADRRHRKLFEALVRAAARYARRAVSRCPRERGPRAAQTRGGRRAVRGTSSPRHKA